MPDSPFRETDLPRSVEKPTVPIVRCNSENRYKLPFYCLSHKWIGYETHYSGRTVPCPGEDRGCRLCKAGRRLSWEGYVAATDPVHRTRQFLVVLTPGIMSDVAAWLKANGTLRGLYFLITRPSCKPTGRCYASINRPPGVLPADLPKTVDVRGALARIWKGSLELAYGESADAFSESLESKAASSTAGPDGHLHRGNGAAAVRGS